MKRPGLILALPRSGTNWTTESLKAGDVRVLMEPLWLHNGESYEENPLCPTRSSSVKDVSSTIGHKGLENDPYGQLLTKNLLDWITENDGRVHLFKETDGFFHLEWLLKSVPTLKNLLITRDVRGNIASFKKGMLFEKWQYREKLKQVLKTINSTSRLKSEYSNVFDESVIKMPPWRSLAFYLGVSMLEIRKQISQLADKDVLSLEYEQMVRFPQKYFEEICDFFEVSNNKKIVEKAKLTTTKSRIESIHNTYKRKKTDDFRWVLTPQEADDIEEIWKGLGLEIKGSVKINGKKVWPNSKELKKKGHIAPKSNQSSLIANMYRTRINSTCGNYWVPDTYVTNSQYASFIMFLLEASVPIQVNGRYIFYNDRPQSRIHLIDRECVIEEGYENHPATHMNLVGAATFSKWLGGRLPLVDELKKFTFVDGEAFRSEIDRNKANYGHFYGGTTPVKSFEKGCLGLYDPVGNVSAWTADKFTTIFGIKTKFEYSRIGGAWSHPVEECLKDSTVKGRPWWLAASTIGLRPVFSDNKSPDEREFIAEIFSLIKKLTDKSISIDNKNLIIHNYLVSSD